MALPRDSRQQARKPDRALRDVLEPASLLHLLRLGPERPFELFRELGEQGVEGALPHERPVGRFGELARLVEQAAERWRDGGGRRVPARGEREELVGGSWGEEGRGKAGKWRSLVGCTR